MKTCIKCKNVLPDNEPFCTRCGGIDFIQCENVNKSKINQQGQRPQGQRPQGQRPQGQRPQGNISSGTLSHGNKTVGQRPVGQRPVGQNDSKSAEKINNSKIDTGANIFDITTTDTSSVKDWIFTFIFMLIPVYNIIFIYKTIKKVDTPAFKKNYMKAFLIYFAVAFAISLIISLVFTSKIASILA